MIRFGDEQLHNSLEEFDVDEKQKPASDRTFTKSVIKSHLRQIMKACDNDPEREFLEELGKLRENVVFQNKYLTDDQFDEMCQELLDDLDRERDDD